MEEALIEARKAYDMGEIPIGAVIEKDGRIIGRGHNQTESLKDPTAHGEILAIKQAAKALGGGHLEGCTIYVTCEPCSMCAGAIVWARIKKVVVGTMDEKSGACGSVFNIIQEERLNHQAELVTGVMEQECSMILKEFFKELRERGKRWKKI